MPRARPSSPLEFADWMSDNHAIDYNSGLIENHYNLVAPSMREQVERSAFWQAILGRYNDWNVETQAQRGKALFREGKPMSPLFKSFESLLSKAYRKNVVDNSDNWPNPPIGDWITPVNWLERFSDIVRTTLYVRYIEDIKPLLRKLADAAESTSTRYSPPEYVARFDGFYGVHFVASIDVKVPDTGLIDVKEFKLGFEIQISTQIKEVITPLLHELYERDRLVDPSDPPWAWDYSGTEFSAHYLAHIMHYVEGMMAATRERMNLQ